MPNVTGSDAEEYPSAMSFDATLEHLVNTIEKAGMTVFARIDHAAGARQAGLTMPPTVVVIYGHPKGGTPIMLAAPKSALDLPLRVLVREAAPGQVMVSFHPIAAVLREAGVPDALASK